MDPKKPKVVVNLYAGDWNIFSATTTVYNRKAITIFKECVGRIYDPQKKAWLFPNTNYTYLIEQLARCDELEIGATIPREYLDKIQCVVTDENEVHFYVQTPFDEAIVSLFHQLNGYWMPEKKIWCFETSNKPDFHLLIQEKGYEIKYEKDKPKSNCFLTLLF